MNATSLASQGKTSLAFAILVGAASAGAITAASAATDTAITVAYTTLLGRGDAVTGALPMTQPIHIEVALKLRDRAGLDRFIASTAKNGIGGVARPMASEQFLANHAPTQVQAQTVANYLTTMGYRNVVIAPNRLLVSADGTAATARNAFMTSFAQVKMQDGRIAFANTTEVRVPTALKDYVLAVVGLQTVHQAHTFARRLDPDGAHTHAITGHNPNDFSSIYSGTGVATAAGVTIGIVTVGKLTQTIADLKTFTTNNGLSSVTTATVNTHGTSTDTSGVTEWNLDSQDVVGMAGGRVGKIIFYNVPSFFNSDLVADFNTIVSANKAKIINVSLGECETGALNDGSVAAADAIFQAAVAQGQTFSISTGDSGADECPHDGIVSPIPSWPADSPYVIAAAGTTLDASTTTWNSETVWNGSGGSPSTFEPMPSWQTAFGVSGSKRGVADIAFDANPSSGSRIYVNGGLQQWGGTSLAAPIFAGMWARVIAVKGTSVGFAGPLIYALPASDFHDVTSGSNAGETAAVGYDFASGRGSIILNTAINHLVAGGVDQPPVANFGFATVGLTANFTDSSTDPDGTVASYSWNFGDGSPAATSANPSRVYSVAGPYSVSETVTDNLGSTNTRTVTVTVNSGGSLKLLGNTGFETGTAAPWVATANVVSNSVGESAHGGSWDAWLNGLGSSHTDTLTQQVAIPGGMSLAALSFYLHTDTADTTASAHDKLRVQITTSTGVVLATLATYSNLDQAAGYTLRSLDMTPYIGQTVKIKFSGVENATLQTSFVVDDVSLTVQ